MKIELLISAVENGDNPQAVRKGDIITAQKSGHNWGQGDLAGRFIFITEATLPCETEKEQDRRCSKCGHYGIEWETFPPVPGTKGTPKNSCPLQKYANANATLEYKIDIHGVPGYLTELGHKSSCSMDYKTKVSSDTWLKIEAENPRAPISTVEKEARELVARKESNIITERDIKAKTISPIAVVK